jgi:hypothetical protein
LRITLNLAITPGVSLPPETTAARGRCCRLLGAGVFALRTGGPDSVPKAGAVQLGPGLLVTGSACPHGMTLGDGLGGRSYLRLQTPMKHVVDAAQG